MRINRKNNKKALLTLNQIFNEFKVNSNIFILKNYKNAPITICKFIINEKKHLKYLFKK